METPRIPSDYMESLFGPAVHDALATLRREIDLVRAGGSSELLDTLIVYEWKSIFGPYGEEPATVSPPPSARPTGGDNAEEIGQ